jgi:Uma2 family endonuclease
VLAAPFVVRMDPFNELKPDVLATRFADLTEQSLPRAPVLAVEVVSPSSGLRDRSLKKLVYERIGVLSYWIVDPSRERPALTAYELADGSYRELATVTGRQSWKAVRPFPVRVRPADLIAGLKP